MYLVLNTNDEKEWRALLPARTNVFGSLEFARILEAHTRRPARLFVVKIDSFQTAYPFFLRPLAELPFVSNNARLQWDTSSPEYTGPLSTCPPNTTNHFRACWETFCQAQGIVAEFAHLHPWDSSIENLEPSQIQFDREIIHVNLELSEQELWHTSFSYACRKNIQRAQKEHVRVFQATIMQEIFEFHRVYTETMTRNHAQHKYFFPLNYFVQFFEQMPNHARFVLAEYQGRIIAGTLYLHDDVNVYSYLGGADASYQTIRPTNAVVYDTILWAKQNRKKRLVLGGGYFPDDGIYRFKSSFSPLRAKLHVYKKIHQPEIYTAVCDDWIKYYSTPLDRSFFPAYRSIPITKDQES